MIKCANCDSQAVYTLSDPAVNNVDYCPGCLPRPFHQSASRGEFPLREEVPAPEPKTKKEK